MVFLLLLHHYLYILHLRHKASLQRRIHPRKVCHACKIDEMPAKSQYLVPLHNYFVYISSYLEYKGFHFWLLIILLSMIHLMIDTSGHTAGNSIPEQNRIRNGEPWLWVLTQAAQACSQSIWTNCSTLATGQGPSQVLVQNWNKKCG